MLKQTTIICSLVLLAACSESVRNAKQAVEDSIGLHSKLEFSDIETFPGDVVCGNYRVEGSLSVPSKDKQPFLSVRGSLYPEPGRQLKAFYCTDDPATVLLENHGIGPYDRDNAELAQITADMTTLDDALEAYYRDHFFFPATSAGLAALVTAPEDLAQPEKYPDGGYVEAIPADPWGRPYAYEEEQWGRTKGTFTLSTLGADGEPGGGGKNADISSALLPYLQHIAYILNGG